MAIRKNFSFRYEWTEKIAHLNEKTQFEILTGTVTYAKTGEFPATAGAEARAAFEEHILPDFIKRAKAAEYRARAKARKAAAEPQKMQQVPAESAPAPKPAEPTPAPRLSRAERRLLEKAKAKERGRNVPGRGVACHARIEAVRAVPASKRFG